MSIVFTSSSHTDMGISTYLCIPTCLDWIRNSTPPAEAVLSPGLVNVFTLLYAARQSLPSASVGTQSRIFACQVWYILDELDEVRGYFLSSSDCKSCIHRKMASSDASIIELDPASAAFVAGRVDTLGPWVLGSFADCILMGVVFCQVNTFFKTRTNSSERTPFQRYCFWLVIVVFCLSMLKTMQEISVWVQNVHDFANPDVARLRVSEAWWQVSTPLMTGFIGLVVQSFFCLRFYLLSRNGYLVVPIVCFMTMGITGICLTVYYILSNNVTAKVRWLLIHLVGVFVADFLITTGTFLSLRKRAVGLERTNLLVNRLVRMVFESAIPPTVIASIDLVMTQTLFGPKLLWHLLLNFTLGKIYVISLLYTLNSINEYRMEHENQGHEIYTATAQTGRRLSRRNNLELGNMNIKTNQIFIQTQVSTHVSPSPGRGRAVEIHALNKRESDPTISGSDFKAENY
ncbi:hypothetical protein B0H11DRAFT_714457 [Mycena galericulata]|nr:hypothetical protein B0H11DRAFT_714457 [Mycena galericulata]